MLVAQGWSSVVEIFPIELAVTCAKCGHSRLVPEPTSAGELVSRARVVTYHSKRVTCPKISS